MNRRTPGTEEWTEKEDKTYGVSVSLKLQAPAVRNTFMPD